jgi:hypothetical protein
MTNGDTLHRAVRALVAGLVTFLVMMIGGTWLGWIDDSTSIELRSKVPTGSTYSPYPANPTFQTAEP